MIPFKFRINLFSEIERVLNQQFIAIILSPILDELTHISKIGTPKEKQGARMAIELAKATGTILPVHREEWETVDDIIVRIAMERKYIVATNDKELRKRLRSGTHENPVGVPVLYLRARSYIEIDGFID